LNLLEGRPVHPRCARIGAGQRIGVPKDVIAADLVVEDVEAESGLRLRLTIELSLKVPDLFGRFEAHRQSPPPRRLRKRIRSQGPFLRRNYPTSQESVREHHEGLHSFRSMRRMEARRRKASALRLRHSQSLASLRQRPSQARVRSTIQRLGRVTKPLA